MHFRQVKISQRLQHMHSVAVICTLYLKYTSHPCPVLTLYFVSMCETETGNLMSTLTESNGSLFDQSIYTAMKIINERKLVTNEKF